MQFTRDVEDLVLILRTKKEATAQQVHAHQKKEKHTFKTYKCTHRAVSKKPLVSSSLNERGHSSGAKGREREGGKDRGSERERASGGASRSL